MKVISKYRLQPQVNDIFANTLISKEHDYKLSYPLIPRISSSYLKNRIMLIGQETNTWYNTYSKNGDYNDIFLKNKEQIEKNGLIDRYDVFVNKEVEQYGGRFWDFSRLLYDEKIIDGNIVENKELTHCWINIFCMEACSEKNDSTGRPTKNRTLRNVILRHQNLLIHQLIQLLEPKLIIFLTGHPLDHVILDYGLNTKSAKLVKIDNANILEEKHACTIELDNNSHISNPTILRLYHPTYFMGYINGHSYLRKKLAVSNEICSVSEYYLRTIIQFLKKWKESL